MIGFVILAYSLQFVVVYVAFAIDYDVKHGIDLFARDKTAIL